MRMRRSVARACTAVALAALPCACAERLMPTPVGFAATGGDPFARTPAHARTDEVKLYVASNRGVRAGAPPNEYFTTERSEQLRLGTMGVAIAGDGMPWPELEGVSRTWPREDGPEVSLRSIDDFGPVWQGIPGLATSVKSDAAVIARFAESVKADLAASTSKQLFVFVHGFNTTVPGNAAVAACMFHYLGRDGAFLSFEWPSCGDLFAYQADKTAAAASIRMFRELLAQLGARTGAERIHVLAHSAGAPVAVDAFLELRLMHSAEPAEKVRDRYRLGRLVLVAPDMDLGEFRDAVADGATELPERVTLYVNSRDKALDIASWITGFARLGQPLGVLTPRQVEFLEDDANVDLVDVAGAENRFGSWLGHSYFHEDPWVSTDVLMALSTPLHPLDRGLQRDEGRKVYAFGPAYPGRAQDAARKAFPAAGTAPAGTPAPPPPLPEAASTP
jgi:esterase/lipase superfamily enzyme